MPPLEEILEQFIREYRAGGAPALSDYQKRWPEYAQAMGELFPTMILLEKGGRRETLSPLSPGADSGSESELRSGGIRSGGPLPERIDNYRILREIGRGGMGIVYEAQDETLDRRVALKVLRCAKGDEEQAILRFQREARTAAKLHHTNIVPVFGTGFFQDEFYYVMQAIRGIGIDRFLDSFAVPPDGSPSAEDVLSEDDEPLRRTILSRFLSGVYGDAVQYRAAEETLVDGGSIAADLSNEHFPNSRFSGALWRRSVCGVGIQVANALAFAHRHDVLHRDIKPSNLLLDEGGVVWVTDFGLARSVSDSGLTRSGQLIGTLRYLAPEAVSGTYTPQGDLYSLGLTLYEMLVFRPAFPEENYAQLLAAISESRITPPRRINPTIPRDLETIILKATDRDPRRRYQTGSELADDLRRFLEERPIRARRISALGHAWRWCRRNRLAAAMIALAAALLIALTLGMTAAFVAERSLRLDRERETARARMNLNLARTAFNDIFSVFGETVRSLNLPAGCDALYRRVPNDPVTRKESQVLESLLKFYEQFAAENGGDEKLLIETARAYANIGRIRLRLGDVERSISAFKKSFEFYERGMALADSAGPLQLEFGQLACFLFAGTAGPSADLPFFGAALDRSIFYLERPFSDPEEETRREGILSRAYFFRALTVMQRETQTPDGLKNGADAVSADLERSAALLDRQIARTPDSAELLTARQLIDAVAALAQTERGDFASGAALRERSVRGAAELVERFPDRTSVAVAQIKVIFISVYTLRVSPDPRWPLQLEQLAEADRLAEKLKNGHPDEAEYFVLLINVRHALAETHRLIGNAGEALDWFRLSDEGSAAFRNAFPKVENIRPFVHLKLDYVEALLGAKKYAEAREKIDALHREAPEIWNVENRENSRAKERLRQLEEQLKKEETPSPQ